MRRVPVRERAPYVRALMRVLDVAEPAALLGAIAIALLPRGRQLEPGFGIRDSGFAPAASSKSQIPNPKSL